MSRRSKQLSAFIMVLLAAGLGWGDARGSQAASRPTIDPEPPLALDVELVSLQKSAKGGVATLRLNVKAQMVATGVVVTAKVPGKLVFSDGSAQKSWNVSLDASGTASLSADVIASEDGKFVVSAEVSGSIEGRPVHRGAALKLLVGVREPAPRVKDGAIEYAGSQSGGA
jgi:hypothetical protein